MKALYKMDDLDKANLLFALFPEQLTNIQNTINEQCNFYMTYESEIRKVWNAKGFLTVNFWYNLVYSASDNLQRNKGHIWKKPKSFADFFFDGNDSIFTKDCLNEYAESEDCDWYLKKAINMLFDNEKVSASYFQKSSILSSRQLTNISKSPTRTEVK